MFEFGSFFNFTNKNIYTLKYNHTPETQRFYKDNLQFVSFTDQGQDHRALTDSSF